MKSRFLVSLFLLLPAVSLASEDLFDIKPVADGVYAAISKPAYKLNCNAAIILIDDGVLVVNTHFHSDHYQGNQAYPSSWPAGVEIISSEATRANIQRLGIPRVKNEIVIMPQEIANLKKELEKASTTERKNSIQENIQQAESYLPEL